MSLRFVGNGWVYEILGITERFTIKPHKVKYELNTPNLALSAQFFIYRVTSWPFLSFVILSFIFAASFLSTVRWGRQALLQVLEVRRLVRPANVLDYEALAIVFLCLLSMQSK